MLFCLPLAANAALDPLVQKGPVITGVTQTEAWVAWGTKHSQGDGFLCRSNALTGSNNTQIPTLTLTPAGASATFSDRRCSKIHRVHLTGLRPDTLYLFTLDQPFDDGAPAGGTFRTAPASTTGRVSFVVYGDNRESPVGQRWRDDHEAVATGILDHEPDAPLLVHTGDVALNIPLVSGDDRGYTEFFDVERGLLGSRPIFVAIGNHEKLETQEFDDLLCAGCFAGEPDPYYYSVDWGPVHVAYIDAFEGPPSLQGRDTGISDAQVAWLEADLEAAANRGQVLFAAMHQGPFSHGASGGHGGSQPVRDRILPILLKWGVYASLAGHDHYYQRGFENCLSYVITGAGGAPLYDPDPGAPEVAFTVKQNSYAVITVDGARVTGFAKDTQGGILDTFELKPADGTLCGVPPARPPKLPEPDPVDAGTPEPVDAGPAPEPVDAGPEPDAGRVEAPADAGAAPVTAAPDGCGCASSSWGALGLAALIGRRRRTRAERFHAP